MSGRNKLWSDFYVFLCELFSLDIEWKRNLFHLLELCLIIGH